MRLFGPIFMDFISKQLATWASKPARSEFEAKAMVGCHYPLSLRHCCGSDFYFPVNRVSENHRLLCLTCQAQGLNVP